MDVLVGCECSGRVRDAFRAKGLDAWSCDLKADEQNSVYHYKCDIKYLLKHTNLNKIKLFIVHPDCTYLCNSGIRWLTNNPERWARMMDAADFFKQMLNAPIARICVENPIMHRHAVRVAGSSYTQIIQPYQFGEPFSKATCLWLKGLPKLIPTRTIPKSDVVQACHLEGPSPERAANRARTYQGIANAMAEQWSTLL
jgi:hypothetical protein